MTLVNPVEIIDMEETLQEAAAETESKTNEVQAELEVPEQITTGVDHNTVDAGLEAEEIECTIEGPLTPAISEASDISKSASNSGRVTPASQSDVASVSSSEKSTPTRKRRSADLAGGQMEFDSVSTSSGSVKGLKLPSRVGIQWRKGERLEAMDFMEKWFPAKIREVNVEEMEVLIHFDGWNQRYDEWLPMTSERLRPMTRHSARKDENRKARTEFKIGERVLAKWTDCKMYEAKISAIFPNGTVEVIFYDGFKKLVQPINLRPMPPELKARSLELKSPPSDAPKKSKVKLGSAGSRKNSISSDDVPKSEEPKKPSFEKDRPRSKTKDQRHRRKLLVSESIFARPKSSQSENSHPGQTLTPVLKLGPVVTQTDKAAKQVTTVDPELPGTSQTAVDPVPSTSDSFITAGGIMPVPKKAFVVESDHNQYKCPFENCGKGFRKENLLEYHIKYYHINGGEPPAPAPPKKRRKTISIYERTLQNGPPDSDQAKSSGKKPASKKKRHMSEGGVRPTKKRHSIEQGDTAAKKSQQVTDLETIQPVDEPEPVVKTEPEGQDETFTEAVDTADIQETEALTSPGSSSVAHEDETESMMEGTKSELKTEVPKPEPRSGSKHRRSESQDTTVTEESTDAEDYLKPDELVNCICGFYEENGLMIQCEVCMCWQHASCFGITDRTLPKVYVCYVCENPPGVRGSSRYIHEQDWLKTGEMASFSYLSTQPPPEERCNTIKATHSLVADINQLNSVLHALKLQLKILRTKDEKQLKQWHVDWDMVESLDESLETNQSTESAEGNSAEDKAANSNVAREGETSLHSDYQNTLDKTSENTSDGQEINEEKTGTENESTVEGEKKLGDKNADSLPGDSEGQCQKKEANKEVENEGNSVQEKEETKCLDRSSSMNGTEGLNGEAGPSSVETDPSETKVPQSGESSKSNGTESVVRDKVEKTLIQIPSMLSILTDEDPNYSDSTESALVDEDPIETCERNLVQHILRVQGEISRRMDLIEEQINVLEALESQFTGQVNQGQESGDIVQLKKNVRSMDSDLAKVKRMAVFH